MVPKKLKQVTEWPTLENCKQRHSFVTTAPLHQLTSFSLLKKYFITATILALPDPSCLFITKVDPFDVGWGHLNSSHGANIFSLVNCGDHCALGEKSSSEHPGPSDTKCEQLRGSLAFSPLTYSTFLTCKALGNPHHVHAG